MTQTLLLLRIRGWGMVGLTSTRNRRDVGRALTDDGWVPGWWTRDSANVAWSAEGAIGFSRREG